MKEKIEKSSDGIMQIADEMKRLSDLATIQYKDRVNDILCGKIENEQEIARIMDGMLDFCQFDNMLQLFKHLCRELYAEYPLLVQNYISYYREIWDQE